VRCAVALVALVALVAACTSPTSTPSPTSTVAGSSASAAASESPAQTAAPVPPDPDGVALERVAGPFTMPAGIANAGDGSGRLFIVEQGGVIRIVGANGAVAATPFLDISSRIAFGGERGLLGLAFHPRYAANGRFFVDYTRASDGATVIAEYRATADAGLADPASERILLIIPQPAPNHNGGMLAFGPDGYLYIGMGDGGGQNDQFQNAQDPNRLLGKILRIDVDTPGSSGRAYAIPPDNPFFGGGGSAEVWTVGERNPWRFSFDREWGDLWVGDVGGGDWEEIDRQPADAPGGLNYGWPIMEGKHCKDGASCTIDPYTLPVAEYGHDQGCAVVGGYVYRGEAQPGLTGVYLFGDWCSGLVFTLQADAGTVSPKLVLRSGLQISSFGEDESGEIYLVDLAGGGLYHVTVP
jgi:glucose/arabinose dehydrogenase